MNIGTIISIDKLQAAIMFDQPTGKLTAGHRNNYAGYGVEVVDVKGDVVQIRRVAAYDATEPVDNFHPLDHYNDGDDKNFEKGGGGTLTITILGPTDLKTLKPGTEKGGEVVEKVDILGPELKMGHPPGYFTNKPINDPVNTNRTFTEAIEILENIKRMRKTEGIDNPIIAVKES